jgi:hypothetical protein
MDSSLFSFPLWLPGPPRLKRRCRQRLAASRRRAREQLGEVNGVSSAQLRDLVPGFRASYA